MTTIQFESKLIFKTGNKALKNTIMILLGTLFLAISAQIIIPLQPVPITLQSIAVLFIGMIFGPRVGGVIVFTYLCEGLCGLPVFANFDFGYHVLLGPSGGYLISFMPGAILAGYLLQKGWVKYRVTIFLAGLLGTIVIFIPGYFVLAKFIGFHQAYLFGVAPFIVIEFCKLAFFTVVTPFFWKKQ